MYAVTNGPTTLSNEVRTTLSNEERTTYSNAERSNCSTEETLTCSNEERRFRMKYWCSKLNLTQDIMHLDPKKLKHVVRNMYVDDKHKVLFCSIPKSG